MPIVVNGKLVFIAMNNGKWCIGVVEKQNSKGGLATQIASQFALTGHTTADKRLRCAPPELPSATSFIRRTLVK